MAINNNSIKITTMINAEQYKNLNSEIVACKIRKEKRVGLGEVVRRSIDHFFSTKNKKD